MRSKKPTLIACRTIIGLGAPTKAGTAATHGSPLGGEEAAAAKQALGWHEPPFTVPDELLQRWRAAGSRGAGARRAWLKRLAMSFIVTLGFTAGKLPAQAPLVPYSMPPDPAPLNQLAPDPSTRGTSSRWLSSVPFVSCVKGALHRP